MFELKKGPSRSEGVRLVARKGRSMAARGRTPPRTLDGVREVMGLEPPEGGCQVAAYPRIEAKQRHKVNERSMPPKTEANLPIEAVCQPLEAPRPAVCGGAPGASNRTLAAGGYHPPFEVARLSLEVVRLASEAARPPSEAARQLIEAARPSREEVIPPSEAVCLPLGASCPAV